MEITAVPGHADGQKYKLACQQKPTGNDREAETKHDRVDDQGEMLLRTASLWKMFRDAMFHREKVPDTTAKPGGKYTVTSKKGSTGNDQEAETEDDEDEWEDCESEMSSDGESPCPMKSLCDTMARCEMVPDVKEMPGGKYLVTWQHQSACDYPDEQDLEAMEAPDTFIERYRFLLRKINAVAAMTSAKPGEKTQLLDEIRSKAKEWGVMN